MAVRTSAIEVTRTTARLRLRRVSHQTANTSGMTRSASSAHGQEKGESDHPARTGYGEHGARGEQREG